MIRNNLTKEEYMELTTIKTKIDTSQLLMLLCEFKEELKNRTYDAKYENSGEDLSTIIQEIEEQRFENNEDS